MIPPLNWARVSEAARGRGKFSRRDPPSALGGGQMRLYGPRKAPARRPAGSVSPSAVTMDNLGYFLSWTAASNPRQAFEWVAAKLIFHEKKQGRSSPRPESPWSAWWPLRSSFCRLAGAFGCTRARKRRTHAASQGCRGPKTTPRYRYRWVTGSQAPDPGMPTARLRCALSGHRVSKASYKTRLGVARPASGKCGI